MDYEDTSTVDWRDIDRWLDKQEVFNKQFSDFQNLCKTPSKNFILQVESTEEEGKICSAALVDVLPDLLKSEEVVHALTELLQKSTCELATCLRNALANRFSSDTTPHLVNLYRGSNERHRLGQQLSQDVRGL